MIGDECHRTNVSVDETTLHSYVSGTIAMCNDLDSSVVQLTCDLNVLWQDPYSVSYLNVVLQVSVGWSCGADPHHHLMSEVGSCTVNTSADNTKITHLSLDCAQVWLSMTTGETCWMWALVASVETGHYDNADDVNRSIGNSDVAVWMSSSGAMEHPGAFPSMFGDEPEVEVVGVDGHSCSCLHLELDVETSVQSLNGMFAIASGNPDIRHIACVDISHGPVFTIEAQSVATLSIEEQKQGSRYSEVEMERRVVFEHSMQLILLAIPW